ncbi:MAG: ATP-binding protein [Chthoniobacterales bacterium]|nr:ATP-binding protein [Chthoniobacterales bacterium]
MSVLAKIKRGGEGLPPRTILAGPEGIGKSTFAANAPAPLFVSQEDGLTGLDHVARVYPESFGEILALCDELAKAPKSDFETLVIDTVDWLERAIHAYICKRDNKQGIEDYGYGKGYKVAEQELVSLLTKLDALRHGKRMGIILLSHVHIRTFSDPAGETWDRYEMKGHKGFTGILREWPDACLFATYEVFKTKERGETRERTIGGERIIHTTWSPGWDAKNRLALPETLPLEYDAYALAVRENSPSQLRDRFLALLKSAEMPEADKKKWAANDPATVPADRLKAGIAKLEAMQPKTK